MRTRAFWLWTVALWSSGCLGGVWLEATKVTIEAARAADGGQPERAEAWWVDTWHDDGRAVTCWSNLRGFSCLPDAVVGGTTRTAPVDAGGGPANAICHDVERGETCFVDMGGTSISCLPDGSVTHR